MHTLSDRTPPCAPESLIAAAFCVAVLALALSGRVDSDEGRLTYLGAQLAADDLAAGLFLQKLHPTLSLLYLPTVALGWKGFAVAHVLLAALGVLAVGRWARRLGGDGWLAALTVAASPAYWFSAATGQSNSDGLALLAVGLWLYEGNSRRQRVAAGAVLGLTVWARYEFAAFVGVLMLVALARPGRRDTALGALVFLLLYLPSGAVYHRATLWFVQNPPMESTPAPGLREAFGLTLTPSTVRRIFAAYALVSSAWGLLLTPAASGGTASARAVRAVGTALLLAFTLSPFFGVDGPEVKPRYLSVALPAVAFAASRARAADVPRALPWVLLLVTLAWLGATTGAPSPWPVLALSAAALVAPAAVLLLPRASRAPALALLVVLSAVVTALAPGSLDGFESTRLPALEAEAVLRAAAARRPALVVTNVQSLVPLLARAGLASARYLPSYDVVLSLHALANRRNGQYASVVRGFRAHYELGGAIWSCEVVRHEFRAGDLVVLGDDWRAAVLVPDAVWEPHTERVGTFGRVTIRRFTAGPVRVQLPTPPAWIDPRALSAPCLPDR